MRVADLVCGVQKTALSSLNKMVRHLRYLHLWSFFPTKLKGIGKESIKLR